MQDHLLDDKLAAARHYLASQFPEHTVQSSKVEDPEHAAWPGYVLRIDHSGRKTHLVYLSEEFLDDHKVSEIDRLLRERRVADKLRHAGTSPVLVTNHGIQIQTEN